MSFVTSWPNYLARYWDILHGCEDKHKKADNLISLWRLCPPLHHDKQTDQLPHISAGCRENIPICSMIQINMSFYFYSCWVQRYQQQPYKLTILLILMLVTVIYFAVLDAHKQTTIISSSFSDNVLRCSFESGIETLHLPHKLVGYEMIYC